MHEIYIYDTQKNHLKDLITKIIKISLSYLGEQTKQNAQTVQKKCHLASNAKWKKVRSMIKKFW